MFDDLKAHFFEGILEPYKEYVKVRNETTTGLSQDLRYSINVATALYHFREHFPSTQRKTRKQLSQICSDYDLLGDVVNAAKHHELTKGTPKLVSAKEIYEEIRGTEYKDLQGKYICYEKEVVVSLLDGSKRDLYEIMTNVLNMWIDELYKLGIISDNNKFLIEKKGIPPRMSDNGAAHLDIKITQGVRFGMILTLQKYNYDTSVGIKFTNARTGEIIEKIIELTEEQSIELSKLKNEKEKNEYLSKSIDFHKILEETISEKPQND